MKKILAFLIAGLFALTFTACETYEVDAPDMTAVHNLDGQWVCFAYDPADMANPKTVFVIVGTNTTNNDPNRMWFTIGDQYPYVNTYFLDALRFELTCDNNACTFSCDNVDAEQPNTCYNVYLAQGYYTMGYRKYVPATGYKVTVTDGQVTKNGVNTHSGYKADAIEFKYTRIDPDGTRSTYVVKGMKNTGWGEDMKEYADFLEAL